MKNINNNDLSEQIRKINHRVNYVINESPRYRQLVGEDDEFDEIPLVDSNGQQEDAPKLNGGTEPPVPSNSDDIPKNNTNNDNDGAEPPVPAFDSNGSEEIPTEPPVEDVNTIQNDIIKSNIEAMKSIHNQLEMLNKLSVELDSKVNNLTNHVEEVREPTNTEKLMNKTQVSYPYYFNLNDLWSNNWFNQQREKETEKGIRELPDGTFIADFDELPQQSKIDVQNSFNDFD